MIIFVIFSKRSQSVLNKEVIFKLESNQSAKAINIFLFLFL